MGGSGWGGGGWGVCVAATRLVRLVRALLPKSPEADPAHRLSSEVYLEPATVIPSARQRNVVDIYRRVPASWRFTLRRGWSSLPLPLHMGTDLRVRPRAIPACTSGISGSSGTSLSTWERRRSGRLRFCRSPARQT